MNFLGISRIPIPRLVFKRGAANQAGNTLKYIREIKKQHPDAAVLTQIGGFFELIDEDARNHGPRMGLDVRYRAIAGPNNEKYTFVSSFPVIAFDKYISRLIGRSNQAVPSVTAVTRHKVVILAQKDMDSEDEAQKRPIYQIISPGTITDHAGSPGELYSRLLNSSSSEYCMAVYRDKLTKGNKEEIALAWADLSTGSFFYTRARKTDIATVVEQIDPQEILVEGPSDQWLEDYCVQPRKFPAAQLNNFLDMFRNPEQWNFAVRDATFAELKAICALLEYCRENLCGIGLSFKTPTRVAATPDQNVVRIDSETFEALETFHTRSLVPENRGPVTLWGFLNRAHTSQAKRLAMSWLRRPLIDKQAIEDRHDHVQGLTRNPSALKQLREGFMTEYDGERALQGVISYEPDEWRLRAVCTSSFEVGRRALSALDQFQDPKISEIKVDISNVLNQISKVSTEVLDVLAQGTLESVAIEEDTDGEISEEENEWILFNQGNEQLLSLPEFIFNEDEADSFGGVGDEYDYIAEFSSLAFDSDIAGKRNPFIPTRRRIEDPAKFPPCYNVEAHTELSEMYRNIQQLKSSFLIEYASFSINLAWKFVKPEYVKQTRARLVWHPRYLYCVRITSNHEIMPRLKSRARVLNQNKTVAYISDPTWAGIGLGRDRILDLISELEAGVLAYLTQLVRSSAAEFTKCFDHLAELDVLSSFAQLALDQNLVRPIISDTPDLVISGSRHPVIEYKLQKRAIGVQFVPNDCILGEKEVVSVITGPNMSGKSTFLRQIGTLAIMAQVGSFVAADSAVIGVCDAIFCRLGSYDDLYQGRSAFMVEMLETSALMNGATKRSLALIDEVGRGTGVQEGEAIAYSTIKYLAQQVQCRTLFTTHFGKELFPSISKMPQIQFRKTTVSISKEGTKPAMDIDYKLGPGVSDQSHGLHIARMAGFPAGYLQPRIEGQSPTT